MALGVEAVELDVRDVGVDHSDRDEAFASVEDLHVQSTRRLTNSGVDEVARLDGAVAEGEPDVCGRFEVVDDVRSDFHLMEALHEDTTSVFSPLALG